MEKSFSVEGNTDVESIGGQIKDTLDVELKKQNDRLEYNKKLDAEIERYDEEKKKQKLLDKKKKVVKFLSSLLHIKTYVGFIQGFEDLIFTVFVDTVLLAMLFSILYGIYIIIGLIDENLWIGVVKISSCIILAIVCVIISNYLPSNSKIKEEL